MKKHMKSIGIGVILTCLIMGLVLSPGVSQATGVMVPKEFTSNILKVNDSALREMYLEDRSGGGEAVAFLKQANTKHPDTTDGVIAEYKKLYGDVDPIFRSLKDELETLETLSNVRFKDTSVGIKQVLKHYKIADYEGIGYASNLEELSVYVTSGETVNLDLSQNTYLKKLTIAGLNGTATATINLTLPSGEGTLSVDVKDLNVVNADSFFGALSKVSALNQLNLTQTNSDIPLGKVAAKAIRIEKMDVSKVGFSNSAFDAIEIVEPTGDSLDLSRVSGVKKLAITGNEKATLSSDKITYPSAALLEALELSDLPKVEKVDVTPFTALKNLKLINLPLKEVDLSKALQLRLLTLDNLNVDALALKQLDKLEELTLKNLKIGGLPELSAKGVEKVFTDYIGNRVLDLTPYKPIRFFYGKDVISLSGLENKEGRLVIDLNEHFTKDELSRMKVGKTLTSTKPDEPVDSALPFVYDKETQTLTAPKDYKVSDEAVAEYLFDTGITNDQGGKAAHLSVAIHIGEPAHTVNRIFGDDRYKTAVAISEKTYNKTSFAILAVGTDFPDALSAGVLAKAYDAPILLSRTANVPDEVLKELKRLDVKNIWIAGGSAVISEKVEKALGAEGYFVQRLYGDNRYDTSVAIAKRVQARAGTKNHVVLANSTVAADALSISPYAADKSFPIVLSDGKTLEPSVKTFLKDQKEVTIVGGKNAISEAVEKELAAMGLTIRRMEGDNRYLTSLKIAKTYFANSTKALLASGTSFADALSGTPLAVRENAPILLTAKDTMEKEVATYLNKAKKVTILGGVAAISDTVGKTIGEK